MKKSKKLIVFVNGKEGYGIQTVWMTIFSKLRIYEIPFKIVVFSNLIPKYLLGKNDYDVELLFNHEYKPPISNIRLVYIVKLIFKIIGQFSYFFKLVKICKKFDGNVFLAQTVLEIFFAGCVSLLTKSKVYWLVPNVVNNKFPFQLNVKIYTFLVNFLKINTVSNSNFTDQSLGGNIKSRYVVHLGVDTMHFKPRNVDKLYRLLKINNNCFIIGLFGRMTESKGQLRLIEAMCRFDKPWHVILCGGPTDGNYFNSILDTIKLNNCQKNVTFLGYRNNLCYLYNMCDIVLNLLDYPEGFGLTIAESMASGTPVIANSLGGPSEIIIDGYNGWLINGADSETILKAISLAYSKKDSIKSIGKNARNQIEMKFSDDVFFKKIKFLFLND